MAAWNGDVGVALLEDSRTNLDTATGGLWYGPYLVAFGVLLFYSILLYYILFHSTSIKTPILPTIFARLVWLAGYTHVLRDADLR